MRLRREPQYVDAIFAAKTERTKMEEVPAMAVPDTEQEQDFIIEQNQQESCILDRQKGHWKRFFLMTN